jgi:hypothetical protein
MFEFGFPHVVELLNTDEMELFFECAGLYCSETAIKLASDGAEMKCM